MSRAGWNGWGLVLVLGLALPSGAWAVGLLEKEHPQVQKGREAFREGRYEEALMAFESAKQERPDDPAVEFNRGDALTKLGRYDEAKEAFQRVFDSNRTDLRQKAAYNLGNLHALTGNNREALKSYRRALTLDPSDAQARHNYEVVLRNLPPPQPQNGADGGQQDAGSDGGTDGGRPDAGQDGGQHGDGGTPMQDGGSDAGSDGGMDGGSDGGQGDGGQGDAGQGDGGQGDAGQGDGGQEQGDGGQGDGGQGDGGEGDGEPVDGGEGDGGTAGDVEETADGGVEPVDLDKQKAEELLDSMKQNEKNLQLWRFQQKKKPRRPDEKDW